MYQIQSHSHSVSIFLPAIRASIPLLRKHGYVSQRQKRANLCDECHRNINSDHFVESQAESAGWIWAPRSREMIIDSPIKPKWRLCIWALIKLYEIYLKMAHNCCDSILFDSGFYSLTSQLIFIKYQNIGRWFEWKICHRNHHHSVIG